MRIIQSLCNLTSVKLYYTLTKNNSIGRVDEINLFRMHLQNAFQRVQFDTSEQNGHAFIIADDLNDKTKALKKALYELTIEGDNYTEYLDINNGLFVDYSDQCCGLQAADICAGVFTSTLKYISADENEKHKFECGYSLLTDHLYKRIRCRKGDFPIIEVYKYGVKEVSNDAGYGIAQQMSKLIEERLEDDLTNF